MNKDQIASLIDRLQTLYGDLMEETATPEHCPTVYHAVQTLERLQSEVEVLSDSLRGALDDVLTSHVKPIDNTLQIQIGLSTTVPLDRLALQEDVMDAFDRVANSHPAVLTVSSTWGVPSD